MFIEIINNFNFIRFNIEPFMFCTQYKQILSAIKCQTINQIFSFLLFRGRRQYLVYHFTHK